MNLNKVFLPRPEDVQEQWIVLDAANQIVGRLATRAAVLLRGKNNICVTPHVKTGAKVIIINASKAVFTGNKNEEKAYWHYTGYRGNKKEYTSKELFAKKPEYILEHAIKGMLGKCKKDRQIFDKNLKVYAGSTHPHKAQNIVS